MTNAFSRTLPGAAVPFLAGVLALFPLRVTAEIIVPLSLDQLAARAELVIRGSVVAVESARDDAGRIFTRIEIAVEETWKGTLATNRFAVVQGGGVLGDRRTTVTGQAEFKMGERAVLFLVLNPRGEGVTLGLAQGKFRVEQDPATAELLVHSLFHGTGATATSRAKSSPGDAAPTRLTLAALKQRVKGNAQ